jgi:hypothetical protein
LASNQKRLGATKRLSKALAISLTEGFWPEVRKDPEFRQKKQQKTRTQILDVVVFIVMVVGGGGSGCFF